jgi:hypothetical protein
VKPERLQQLIADLNNEQFDVREAASKELERLGDLAAETLRKAQADNPSAEVKRRTEAILNTRHSIPAGELLRRLRAIHMLEQVGSKEAQQVLRVLGSGAAEARDTREARESLKRLTEQAGVP